MRGTFFQKPFEYNIEIQGESWKQGDQLKGTCVFKNHSADSVDLSQFGLGIGFADHKKIKAKDPKALKVIQEIEINAGQVNANSEQTIEFDLSLEKNNPISENTKGVYFYVGPKENLFDGGILELPIQPIAILTDFLEIFKRFFRFEVKALKNKKDYIEAKMMAPGSKEMGAVEQLMLLLKIEDDLIKLDYQFKIKKLAYDTGDVKAKSEKLSIKSEIPKNQYLAFGDSLNQEGIQQAITEVLDQVKRKTTF